MTNIHIMLDLETWGTTPGDDIRSIGACVFDPLTGAVNPRDGEHHPSHFYIACDNPLTGQLLSKPPKPQYRYPLTRDPKTVQWWSEQSDEAQAAFADPVDMREALSRFTQWITALDLQDVNGGNQGLRLWSHGPAFDPPILAAVYRAVGLPVPWHYRAPRDTRTIMEAAGMDPHKGLEQFTTGTHHHALDDAICQARAVCAAYGIINRWRNTSNTDDGLVSHLLNITDGIADEGDRAYFASTNDADQLKRIAQDLDANRFERDFDSDNA